MRVHVVGRLVAASGRSVRGLPLEHPRHFCLNSETATGVLSSSRKADLPLPHLQKLLHCHLLLSIPLLLGLAQVFRSSKARAHSASRRSRHKYLTSSFGHASSEGRCPIRLQLRAGNHDVRHGGLGWLAPLARTALRQFCAFFYRAFLRSDPSLCTVRRTCSC